MVLSLALVAGLCVGSRATAADEEPKYPEVGSLIPGPFHPLNLTGDLKGRFHCMVCQYGLHPTTAIFVRLPSGDAAAQILDDKGMLASLVKKLDVAIDKRPDANFGAFVVLMGQKADQVTVTKAVEELVKSADLKHVIFTWEGTSEKDNEKEVPRVPKEYEIADAPGLTVLMFSNYHVLRHQAFTDKEPTEADIDKLVGEFVKQAPPPFVKRKKQ
jgi:hypothetical protein